MSEQDAAESTGSRTPSRRDRDQLIDEQLQSMRDSMNEFRELILGLNLPQRTRASDVGDFATPPEGSVENDPSEDIATARATSPTAAEAAIARHTVGFVPPPL